MESFEDQGLLLSARLHGEGGGVATLFTREHGRFAGYVHGAQSQNKRALLTPGNLLHTNWSAKTHEQLGTYQLDMLQQFSAYIMDDKDKLNILQSLCSLCDASLPEREAQTDFFDTTLATLTVLTHADDMNMIWENYIKWEITLLKVLGFSLDFSRCAGGGNAQTLAYISPKSGCAVSYAAGEPYKEKLLPLPSFLKPNASPTCEEDIELGLNITATFLEKWAFAHHTKGMPEQRIFLQKSLADRALAANT